jgi:hypothetical protein
MLTYSSSGRPGVPSNTIHPPYVFASSLATDTSARKERSHIQAKITGVTMSTWNSGILQNNPGLLVVKMLFRQSPTQAYIEGNEFR